MNKNEIVRLAYIGCMKKDVTVYTFSHKFEGKWFQIDTESETIIIEGDIGNLVIDINSITAIEVVGGVNYYD